MIYAYNPKSDTRPCKPTPWPGIVFPIPLGHWRGCIYRGLFFGVHGTAAQYSPIWSGLACSIRRNDYYVDSNQSRLSASEEQVRHFVQTGALPARAHSVYMEWLCGQMTRGATSADNIPLEIHAIEDPVAYQAAIKAYRGAQLQAFF